jgi:hypothetical protein
MRDKHIFSFVDGNMEAIHQISLITHNLTTMDAGDKYKRTIK